jgi:hypothetical protein
MGDLKWYAVVRYGEIDVRSFGDTHPRHVVGVPEDARVVQAKNPEDAILRSVGEAGHWSAHEFQPEPRPVEVRLADES